MHLHSLIIHRRIRRSVGLDFMYINYVMAIGQSSMSTGHCVTTPTFTEIAREWDREREKRKQNRIFIGWMQNWSQRYTLHTAELPLPLRCLIYYYSFSYLFIVRVGICVCTVYGDENCTKSICAVHGVYTLHGHPAHSLLWLVCVLCAVCVHSSVSGCVYIYNVFVRRTYKLIQ